MVQAVVIWGLVAFSATALAGVLASVKNRDYSFWMSWSFLFPPMAVFLVFLPRIEGKRPRQRTLDEEDAAEA